MVQRSGTLHIRTVRAEDGLAKYSCLTMHQLTQERKRSEPAILTVTGKQPVINKHPMVNDLDSTSTHDTRTIIALQMFAHDVIVYRTHRKYAAASGRLRADDGVCRSGN